MSKKVYLILLFVGVAAFFYYLGFEDGQEEYDFITNEEILEQDTLNQFVHESKYLFGLVIDSLEVIEDIVKPRQNLSSILLPYNVSYATIDKLVKSSKGIFDVRKIAAKKKYTILCANDSVQTAKYFIYQPNQIEYIIFDLGDSLNVKKFEKEIEIQEKSISGVINSSLYESMIEGGASPQLANALSEIFAWQVDFFRVQKEDKFKVIYEEKSIEGEAVGIGKILGAYFEHFNTPFYAIPFDQGAGAEFFDENGGSLRKAFLKAPLNYTRISSRYSLKRFHPVQKRFKAHLGTDYAAPPGTPIMSVGDGQVVEARYSKFNGRFVKVKHNGVYTTQYLHMSKIAKGVRAGTRVKQGQVIGYVGSTGLATGPHLCFRFWKNGKQVDALKVKIPPSHPVKKELIENFSEVKSGIISKLETISYKNGEKIMAQK